MKRLALTASLVLALAHPAWAAEPKALVTRAAKAAGVPTASTLHITGAISYYDPEQSRVPGGESRLGTEAEFSQWRDVSGARSRTEWRMTALRPYTHKRNFVEVINSNKGFVFGVDSMLQVKPNLPNQENSHQMSRTRVAANERELARTAPDLLQLMQQQPARLRKTADIALGGAKLPAVRYASAIGELHVAFEPASGLPALIRQRDYDPIEADSDFDLVLSDWRDVGGWRYPFQQRYELNGRLVATVRLSAVEAQAAPADTFEHPPVPAPEAANAAGPIASDSFQWFIRKQGFAVLLDSDAIFYDPQQTAGLTFMSLAPSVWLATGGFYNSMVVELKDALVVYDAPHDAHAQALLRELAKRFPGKRVSHLVLTHHHMDHAGGVRSYVAAGATVVVGAGLKQHYTEALRRPNTLGLPVLRTPEVRRALMAPKIVEADGPFSIGDGNEGGVRAMAYPIQTNDHAEGMLFGYVPEARVGFVSDLWSPGRPGPLPPAGTEQGENLRALARSVEQWKLDPDRFAGGHGTVGPYAPVGALVR